MASLQSPFLFMPKATQAAGQISKPGKSKQPANQRFLQLFAQVFSSNRTVRSQSEIPVQNSSDQSVTPPDATSSFVWIPEDDSERYFPFPNQTILPQDQISRNQTQKNVSETKGHAQTDASEQSGQVTAETFISEDKETPQAHPSRRVFTETNSLPHGLTGLIQDGMPFMRQASHGSHPSLSGLKHFNKNLITGKPTDPDSDIAGPEVSFVSQKEKEVHPIAKEKQISTDHSQIVIPVTGEKKTLSERIPISLEKDIPTSGSSAPKEADQPSVPEKNRSLFQTKIMQSEISNSQTDSTVSATGDPAFIQTVEPKQGIESTIDTPKKNHLTKASPHPHNSRWARRQIVRNAGQKTYPEQGTDDSRKADDQAQVSGKMNHPFIPKDSKENGNTIPPQNTDAGQKEKNPPKTAPEANIAKVNPGKQTTTFPAQKIVPGRTNSNEIESQTVQSPVADHITQENSTEIEAGHAGQNTRPSHAALTDQTESSLTQSDKKEQGSEWKPSLKNRPQFVQKTNGPAVAVQYTQVKTASPVAIESESDLHSVKSNGITEEQSGQNQAAGQSQPEEQIVQSNRDGKQQSITAVASDTPAIHRAIPEQAVVVDPEAAEIIKSVRIKHAGLSDQAPSSEKETIKSDSTLPKTEAPVPPVKETPLTNEASKQAMHQVHSTDSVQNSTKHSEPQVSVSYKTTQEIVQDSPQPANTPVRPAQSSNGKEARQQDSGKNRPVQAVSQSSETSEPKVQQAAASDNIKSTLAESAPQPSALSNDVQQSTGVASKTESPVRTEVPIVEQIVPKIQQMLKDGETIVRMTLQPKNLGEVRIEIVSDKEMMRAQIMVETREAQALLKDAMPELRAVLESQNIVLPQIAVDVAQDWMMPDGQRGNAREARTNRGFRSKRGRNDSDEKSEPVLPVSRSYGNHTIEYVA